MDIFDFADVTMIEDDSAFLRSAQCTVYTVIMVDWSQCVHHSSHRTTTSGFRFVVIVKTSADPMHACFRRQPGLRT